MKKNIVLKVEKSAPLLEYLLDHLESQSKNNVKSLLTRGNIEIDGKVIKKHDYQLKIGQNVLVKFAKIYDEKNKEVLDILYEDKDILVINKPAGLLSISTENDKVKTAYHMVMDYVKRTSNGQKIFVVHRLDKDTSGVLIFAKNDKIKNLLQNDWNNLVKIRGYIAIVEGKLKKDSGTIKSWLKETKTMFVYSSNKPGDGDEAITHYKKIKTNDLYTMLDIKIDTGRKNQIRVHMYDLGYPIIGDKKYGSTINPIKRLGLHANILELMHPLTNKIMHFEAKIPGEFNKLIK